MEAAEKQGFEFVAVKEELVEDLEDEELSAVQGFEFVAVKEELVENLEDEELYAVQDLNPSELAPCSKKLEQEAYEFSSTASPNVSKTDCIMQMRCIFNSEDCGNHSSQISTPKESNAKASVCEMGQAEIQNRTYICDVCEDVFSSKHDIIQHVFTHIEGAHPPAHVCRFCGSVFSKFSDVKRHIRIHTGEQPYVCDFCGRSFTMHGNMKKHILTHTGERPYRCDICGKTFTQSSSVKTHRRTHKGEQP